MHYVCRHIMPNGSRCDSPALRGKSFCYFHNRIHRLSNAPAPKAGDSFKLPVLEDRCAIQLAVAQVLNEGLDVPNAEVGIIVAGNKGEREYVQRVGRVLRPRPGKRALVYELVVRSTPEVEQSRKRRQALAA